MSDKIIDKIELIKELGDIKKFIAYKQDNKLSISLEEFDKLQKYLKAHNDSNKKNKIQGQDLYFNLDTSADVAALFSFKVAEKK